MVKAIFFDLDGTLVDDLSLYIDAYDATLRHFGFSYDRQKIFDTCFNKTEETVCATLGIPDKVEAFREKYFASLNEVVIPQGELFSGVLDVLNAAKTRRTKMAVVSFAFRWYVEKTLEVHNLKEYFDTLVSFNDVTNPKPHPEAVLKAAKELGISSNEALMVGDAANDIKMGKAAGAKTALHLPSSNAKFYNREELIRTKPDYIFTHYQELQSILTSYD